MSSLCRRVTCGETERRRFLQLPHHTVYNRSSQSALVENGCFPSDVARTTRGSELACPLFPWGSIVIFMHRIGPTSFFCSSRETGLAFLIVCLCICVMSQMLGTPLTLIGLLTSDISVESVSEDFSIPPISPEPESASRSGLHEKGEPVLHLPVFVTSVFHPPQG